MANKPIMIPTAREYAAKAAVVLQGVKDEMESAAEKGQAYRGLRAAMESAAEHAPILLVSRPLDYCQQCGQRILIMINRGQGYCSEQCRKSLASGWEADE
jgi:hypothetical protein